MCNYSNYINGGEPTLVWYGITPTQLLRRCDHATDDEANAMSFVAAMMHACEPISHDDFEKAQRSLRAVEKRLVAEFVGPVRVNRFGRPWGGAHPALR